MIYAMVQFGRDDKDVDATLNRLNCISVDLSDAPVKEANRISATREDPIALRRKVFISWFSTDHIFHPRDMLRFNLVMWTKNPDLYGGDVRALSNLLTDLGVN
jgi:hypothetical protein